MKIDDSKHFAEIERRRKELFGDKKTKVFINGIKAGFDPNQARDESGKWTSGGAWHKIDIKEQVASHKKYGGSTFDPMTGESLAGSKGLGSVALFKERSVILDVDLTEEILAKYIEDNKDLLSLSDGRYSVGTWYGGNPKQLWLDVAFVTDIQAAIKLGKEKNQVAIFDLENLEDIDTGGTGKQNIFIMESKKNKKKFDKFGKYLQANNKKPKVMTLEEFMNGKSK